ncbi:hypothetical protein D8674_039321 [Pyrus ussuriensis x Pyrus communis]|uniref:Transposase MuDR plant domain-containing protein n=1 Tax=Pyrus ussuriensis x Pyrus communis TaxID=2448454 RepID=A0A5N5GZZ1_9ROSA|nr:hypothetical protein D8674_039321 [Pyrus ussuriensis x Pyrus communis]
MVMFDIELHFQSNPTRKSVNVDSDKYSLIDLYDHVFSLCINKEDDGQYMDFLVQFRHPSTSVLQAIKSNNDIKSMFQLFELHMKFVVDLYFDIVNEDENEGQDSDSSGDEGRVPGDVGEGENELFPFTDDEDDDLEPNINGEDVVIGNEYEDYTSKATNDYISSEDEEEVDYMRGLSKRLYKDCPSGKVELKDGQVIQEGFEIHQKKNERTRVTAVCCWLSMAYSCLSYTTMSSITYMIKSYNNEHICTRVKKNSNATSTWIARKLGDRLISDPNMKSDAMKSELKDNYGVKARYI